MADTPSAESPGDFLSLIRNGQASTRAELARLTGLSRSTVSQRIDALMDADFVYESGEAPSNGGRPPRTLAFNGHAGLVLVADLGATHSRLAVVDLSGEMLAETAVDLDIGRGPDEVLGVAVHRFRAMLEDAERDVDDVRGIGVGLPGPVEYSAGRAVSPPIMPGWDNVPVPSILQRDFPVPVLVDNDVNIMALGEYWTNWRHRIDDLLFVKVGTGIGCGVVANGDIYRGAQGAAGDMGHIQVSDGDDKLCRCGNWGCLEAVAGGAAIAAQLRAEGLAATQARDVSRLAREGDPTATRLVRAAGRHIGDVLAGAVNLFNPGAIILGGDVADAANQLVAGVREVVYERSTVLATHDLRIEQAGLGDRAGIIGAGVMIIESILRPRTVDALIASAAGT